MASLAAAVALAAVMVPARGATSKTVLDNGLVVITSPAQAGSIAAVEVLVKAAITDEPADKTGLRQLVQRTLVRGSESMSGEDLAAALDEAGAELDVGVALDYVDIHAVCLGQDLDRVVELLAEVVRRPRFSESEVEGQRELAQRRVQALLSDPFETAQHLLRQGLFGGHPYALPTQGTAQTLGAVTRADLVDFHRRFYVPNNTIIAIAGSAPAEGALAAAQRCFGDWPRLELPPRELPSVPRVERSTMCLRETSLGQAYLMLGFGVGPPNRDTYPVLEAIRALLGRGMGSEFFAALREQAPLAYQASAHHFAFREGGCLAAYVAVEPAELERTKQIIVGEFERLRSRPIDPADLRRAQEYAVGTHALSHQVARERAFHLAWYEAAGLGCEFDDRYGDALESVTAAEVQAAASAHFRHYALGLLLPGG